MTMVEPFYVRAARFHARNAHRRHRPAHWTEDEWQRHRAWCRTLRLSPTDRFVYETCRAGEIELPEWLQDRLVLSSV